MRKKMMVIGILLVIVSIISYFGIIKPTDLSTGNSEISSTQNNNLKIAVVNEDSGMTYNGQSLNIGEILTNSFSAKSGYTVEVVSRSIAERGLDNDFYQLMIVLPSKFSRDSLALESHNPAQAVFQYQIKSDKNYLVKQAEQAVIDLKTLFNKDLISIYFLSIVGNLQTAQTQVGDVVDADGQVLKSFNSNLITPLDMYSKQFTGISSSPTELLSSYNTFQKNLLGSNEAFTSIIDVNKNYISEIDQIKSLQEQWQESILKREESLKTYDEGFSTLSVEEQLGHLTELNDQMIETHRNPPILSDTKTKAEKLKTDVTAFLEQLEELNKEIDQTLSNYDTRIKTAVDESLTATNSYNVDNQITSLGTYLKMMRDTLVDSFNAEIIHFQGYDDSIIDEMSLSLEDKQYLKNLNAFVKNYTATNQLPSPHFSATQSEQGHYHDVVRQTVEAVILAGHEINVEASEGEIKRLELTVPEGYELVEANLSVESVYGKTYVLVPNNASSASQVVVYKIRPVQNTDISILAPLKVDLVAITEEKFDYQVEDSSSSNTPISPDSSNQTTDSSSTQDSSDSEDSTTTDPIMTPQVTYKTEEKLIERRYAKSEVISPYSEVIENIDNTPEQAAFSDLQSYFELATFIKTYYGYQITAAPLSVDSLTESKESLIGQMDTKMGDTATLKSIVINLIKDATITELKNHLKVSEEDIESFSKLLPEAEQLSDYIDELNTNTTQLLDELSQVITWTDQVNTTIHNKPEFAEQEKRDNTSLVTVTMSINSDLEELKNASQTLMDNTKAHQLVSEGIQGQVDRLTTDVKDLETEGNQLSARVDELYSVMSKEYGDNTEFLRAFSTVLSNTKVGNEQNSAVYDYLANPIDSSKIESLVGSVTKETNARQDERSGFLLVLISYLVCIGISHILQQWDRSKWPKMVDVVARSHWTNGLFPFTFLTALSLLVAILMGLFTSYRLNLSAGQITSFILLLFIFNQLFSHSINQLNRYLKSYGFLIILFFVLIYLVSAGQLLDSYYVTHASWLSLLSPLTYLEQMLTAFLNSQTDWIRGFVIVFFLAGGVSVLTLYSYREIEE